MLGIAPCRFTVIVFLSQKSCRGTWHRPRLDHWDPVSLPQRCDSRMHESIVLQALS